MLGIGEYESVASGVAVRRQAGDRWRRPVLRGSDVSYSVAVTNTSAVAIDNVTVNDTIERLHQRHMDMRPGLHQCDMWIPGIPECDEDAGHFRHDARCE